MQNFNGKVRQYLKENERKRHSRLFGIVLSVVMTVSVLASLVMPAISATEGVSAVGVDVGYDGKNFSYKDAKNVSITNRTPSGSGKDQTKKIDFDVIFRFDKGTMKNNCIYFPIDGNIGIPDTGIPANGWGDVEDSNFKQNNGISGKYRVDYIGDQKYLFIIFEEAYQELNQTKDIDGHAKFGADVKRRDDETGESTKVTIGGKNIVINGYTALTLSTSKKGEDTDEGVKWTITVNNPAKDNLKYIEDEMFKDALPDKLTVDPADAGHYNSNLRRFEFEDGRTDEKVEISYVTPYPKDDSRFIVDGKIENTSKTYSDKGSHEANASFDSKQKTTISEKSGEVNYDTNEVTWTVVVNNPQGCDLNGYHLFDKGFNDVNQNDFTVTGEDGKNIDFTVNGNQLTFGENTTSNKITVRYKTTIGVDQQQLDNTVKIQKPNQSNEWEGGDYKTATVYNSYQISKSGKADGATGIFTWTINVKSNKDSLIGQTVSDTMLTKGQEVEIHDANGNILATTTVTDDGKLVLPDGIGDSNDIKIIYKTNASDMNLPAADSSGNIKVTNEASIGQFKTSATADYKPTDEKYKTVKQISQDGNTVTYEWKLELKQVTGAFKGQEISDIMTAESSDNKTIQSFLVPNSISIEYGIDDSYKQFDDAVKYYSVTPSADGKSFTIQFKDDELFDSIKNIRIKYKSTVNVSDVNVGATINVKNKATFKGKDFEPNADTTKYVVDDKDKSPFEKYDANSNSKGDTVYDLTELPVVTIDGVDYYRFDWRLDISKEKIYKLGDTVEIVDTLPEGMILYDNQDYLKYTSGDSTQKNDLKTSGRQFGYTYDKSSNKIIFTTNWNQQDSWTAYYSTIIKVDTVKQGAVKGSVSYKNTVQDKAKKYPEKSQTQTVKEKNITKSSNPKSTGCDITYTIDVNPKKLGCSTSGMITLNDVIKCGGTAVIRTEDAQGKEQTKTVSIDGNSSVHLDLKSIKVYDVDTGKALSTSEYSYVIHEPKTIQKYISCNTAVKDNRTGHCDVYFTPEEYVVGAKGDINISVPAGYEDGNIKSYNISYGYMNNGYFTELGKLVDNSNWVNYGSSVSVPVKIESIDADKELVFKVSYVYRDKNDKSEIDVTDDNIVKAVTITDLEAQTLDSVKKLEITVPDRRHLKIVYVYNGRPANSEDANNKGYKVNVFNNISFDTSGSAVNDSADDYSDFELINQSQASSTTKEPFKVVKVDSGDYSLMLNASFKLYRYSKLADGTYAWLPAIAYNDNADMDRKSVIWGGKDEEAQEFSVTDKEPCNLELEPAVGTGDTEGHLYKLIETKSQEGYQLDPTPIYFAFKVQPEKLPEGVKNYQFIQNGDLFRVTNILQKFKITASKVWSDGNENHSADEVVFKLGRSTTKVLGGIPEDIIWDDTKEITLSEKNHWQYEWTDLPGCVEENGTYKQCYYYIREKNVKTGYETIYSANAISRNTEVTVNNVKGLTITKEWRDELGNELADSELPDSIKVIVYESDTAPNSPTRVNNEYGIPVDCRPYGEPITLKKAENWKHTLNDLNKDKYYYVLEKSVPDGFGVTYTYSNNASGTGFDTIINTKTPKDVKEMSVRLQKAWSDSDTKDHANDKVTFNIYRSTNKNDVPTNYNKFMGTMDIGQNVNLKILGSDGKEISQNGSFSTDYTVYGSAQFKFKLNNAWINSGETKGNVVLTDSSGNELARFHCNGKSGNDLYWSDTSDYISVDDYDQSSDVGFTLNLKNITGDVNVVLTLETYNSTANYEITDVDVGTHSDTNVTTEPSKTPDTTNDAFFVKAVTIDATNNWSDAIKLEANDKKGNKFYYWIEEVEVNGQPVSTSAYKAYYRYNGSDSYNCIDTNGNDQYVQVYNNYEETVGELPETGGRGVLPFAVAGGAITAAATALLVTKRRKKHAENM